MALSTACSFGISLIPVSPSGRTMCATEVQANMAIPPSTPARRTAWSYCLLDSGYYATGRRRVQLTLAFDSGSLLRSRISSLDQVLQPRELLHQHRIDRRRPCIHARGEIAGDGVGKLQLGAV